MVMVKLCSLGILEPKELSHIQWELLILEIKEWWT
jgi:hypothetical protein